jgi:hypothetical protein
MPHGATPSRWCDCQFHHFRLKNSLCFEKQPFLLKTALALRTGFALKNIFGLKQLLL